MAFSDPQTKPQGVLPSLVDDFSASFQDWYIRTGDKSIAKKNALRELSKTWQRQTVDGQPQLVNVNSKP